MEKFDDLVTFRCKREDRAKLKKVSESLSLVESDVARVAFRRGLEILRSQGVRPQREQPDLG
jgi:hypothetical protein